MAVKWKMASSATTVISLAASLANGGNTVNFPAWDIEVADPA